MLWPVRHLIYYSTCTSCTVYLNRYSENVRRSCNLLSVFTIPTINARANKVARRAVSLALESSKDLTCVHLHILQTHNTKCYLTRCPASVHSKWQVSSIDDILQSNALPFDTRTFVGRCQENLRRSVHTKCYKLM